MTRCIAILTLALTATVNADGGSINSDGVYSGTTLGYYSQFEYKWHISGDDDDVQWVSAASVDALIAIIAFEHGPEAAYVTLRDMGFSDREAYDIVLDLCAELDGIPAQMALMQSLCKGEVSHMARD